MTTSGGFSYSYDQSVACGSEILKDGKVLKYLGLSACSFLGSRRHFGLHKE